MSATARLSATVMAMAAAVVFTVGCGPSKPDTYPVTGTVTYKGKPVEGATVGFSSTDPNTQGAIGVTDSQGKYEMTTFERGDGALVGEFKVRVFKYDRQPAEPPMATAGEQVDEMPEDYQPEEGVAAEPPPKHVLPENYARPHSTPLSVTVEAKENVYDIELK